MARRSRRARRSRASRVRASLLLPSAAALAALGLAGALLGGACAGQPPTDLGAGGSFDPGGSTGASTDDINVDVDDEEDTYDPEHPECQPESDLEEDGTCLAPCIESGGICAEDDPDACEGLEPIKAGDCSICCAYPEGSEPGCVGDECECESDADCAKSKDGKACVGGYCGCSEDAHCGAGVTCDVETNICNDFEDEQDCKSDTDCAGSAEGKACIEGLCGCSLDSHCPEGESCDGESETCQEPDEGSDGECEKDADCAGSEEGSICVEGYCGCESDAHCSDGVSCDGGVCGGGPGSDCETDEECEGSSEGASCIEGYCGCAGDFDCDGETCDLEEQICGGGADACEDDYDCYGGACDLTAGVCKEECVADAECAGSEQGGTCFDGTCGCTGDAECGGSTCDVDSNTCYGGCEDDYDCPPSFRCGEAGACEPKPPPVCGDGECGILNGSPEESCRTCKADCGTCFKVMTWNIAAGRKKGTKPERIKKTLRGIAKKIAKVKPDLVALQEVDHKTKRSGGVDQAAYIGKRTKLYARFGAAFKYDGGKYGVAFLSKYKITDAKTTRMDTAFEWDKKRVLLVGDIDVLDEFSVRLGVTQLAGSAAPRLEQAARVSELGEDDFSIVGGDMRARHNSETLQVLTRSGLFDAWKAVRDEERRTYKKSRVDYVLPGIDGVPDPDAPGRMPVVYAKVSPHNGLSDHNAVVMYFQRPREEEGGEGGSGEGGGSSGCTSNEECLELEGVPFCVAGSCSECQTNAECLSHPDYGDGYTCVPEDGGCF